MMGNEPRRRKYSGLSIGDIQDENASRLILGELSVTKDKKRRRTTIDNKCFIIMVFLVVTNTLRHILLFTPYSEDYLKDIHYPIEFYSPPKLRSSTTKLNQLDSAKWRRRRRTTPLPIVEGSRLSFFSQNTVVEDSLDNVISKDSTYPSFPITDYVVGDDICGQDKKKGYNNNDRILISGILSHPVAAELALTLYERCGVRHIVGLSDHLLNTEESSRLEFLLHQIPSLELKVGKGPLGDQATHELIESFLPSHVFYFQPESFKISSDSDGSAFLTHSGRNQLEQICNAIVKMQSKFGGMEATMSLLYVTSSLPETGDSDKNNLAVTIISKSNQILLDAYRVQYQLDARVLELPNIFGPFKEGSLWLLSDEFIHGAKEIADHDENQHDGKRSSTSTTTSFNMTQPIISITDAIRSLLVSGKLGHIPDDESVPILTATKSQTTTLLDLSKNLLPLFMPSNTSNVMKESFGTSLLPILSWNYKTAKPYLDPTEFNISPIENDKIATLGLMNTRQHLIADEKGEHSSFSQLERRQHDLFPCISACASVVKCRSSIWDTIVPIAENATNGCQFLLYAVDFSLTLKELPGLREATNSANWPRDSFCQVAFVSSKSSIVNNTIKNEMKRKGNEAITHKELEEWNGKVSNNGWILVWVDEDEESIPQADSMIPKTNPESILNPSVQYVFYVEPHHYELLPPLQVMWFLMARQLSTPVQRKDDRSGTYEKNRRIRTGLSELTPERHIAFFSHTYHDSDIEHLDSKKPDFIRKAAKFILEQSSKSILPQDVASQKFSTTRQSEAYVRTLLNQKEDGLNFELVDTALMIYPIYNFRGRQFRCEWYEEHLFWSNEDNRNFDGLSLSYVLHRWRRRGRLLRNTIDDKWGEVMLLKENGRELSPSAVVFKKIANKEEAIQEIEPPSDPQHYIKIHSPLMMRKFYSYE
jgi:hypothetical protein